MVEAEAAALQADANATSAIIQTLQRDNLLLRASLDALHSQAAARSPPPRMLATQGDVPQPQQHQGSTAHWVGSPSPAEAKVPLSCATPAPCDVVYDEPCAASEDPVAAAAGALLLCPEPSPAGGLGTSTASNTASDAASDTVSDTASDAATDDNSATDYASLDSASEAGSSLNLADVSSAAAAVLAAMASPLPTRAPSEESVCASSTGLAAGSSDGCQMTAEAVLGDSAAAAIDTAAADIYGSMSPPTHAATTTREPVQPLPLANRLAQDQGAAAAPALADICAAAELEEAAAPQGTVAGTEVAEEGGHESGSEDGYATAEDAPTPPLAPSASAEHGAERSPSLEPSLAATALSFDGGEEASERPGGEESPAAEPAAVLPAKSALTRVRALR